MMRASTRRGPQLALSAHKSLHRHQSTKGNSMSNDNSHTNPPNVKPFGDTQDPLGFYQLLIAHITWLAIHNFSLTTTTKRALYIRAFALWCLERDIVTPCTISKPMIESFQRHLFTHRQMNGKPLAWSSQHLHFLHCQTQKFSGLRFCTTGSNVIEGP